MGIWIAFFHIFGMCSNFQLALYSCRSFFLAWITSLQSMLFKTLSGPGVDFDFSLDRAVSSSCAVSGSLMTLCAGSFSSVVVRAHCTSSSAAAIFSWLKFSWPGLWYCLRRTFTASFPVSVSPSCFRATGASLQS